MRAEENFKSDNEREKFINLLIIFYTFVCRLCKKVAIKDGMRVRFVTSIV